MLLFKKPPMAYTTIQSRRYYERTASSIFKNQIRHADIVKGFYTCSEQVWPAQTKTKTLNKPLAF